MVANTHYARHLIAILVVVCVFQVAAPAQTTHKEQVPPPPIGKLVDVGGYRVHLYCMGSGSPAVVIVGAGFSFNWGLVQPEVAKFTQVCSYDHSGIGWSDDGPEDSCSLRVNEVRTALKNLGIKGPYVLVGHSLGGLVARVYAGQYPDEIAGMVFVDHAFAEGTLTFSGPPPSSDAKALPPTAPPMLLSPSGGPVTIGIESDPNFSKLSDRDRELHLWAMSEPRTQKSMQGHPDMMPSCIEEANTFLKKQKYPLGEKPLIDVSTDELRSPPYVNLQNTLLSLSRNSKEMIAEKSGHFVIIDRPDVVIDGVRQLVQSVRNKTKL